MGSNSKNAPVDRIYSSEPRLRQARFRPRLSGLPRKRASLPAQASESQRTLTQMPDFIVPSSYDDDEDNDHCDIRMTDRDENATLRDISNLSRKRRRIEQNESTRQQAQSTLTQLKWVADSDEDEDNSWMPPEYDMEAAWDAEAENMSTSSQKRSTDQEMSEQTVKRNIEVQRTRSFDRGEERNDENARPTVLDFLTPRKRREKEVPSSQSPAATPFSTRHRPDTIESRLPQQSPSKIPRTPLSEIAPNVLAQRDEDSAKKAKSQKSLKKAASDSYQHIDNDFGDENAAPDDQDSAQEEDELTINVRRNLKAQLQQQVSANEATPNRKGLQQADPYPIIPSTPIGPAAASLSQVTTVGESQPPSAYCQNKAVGRCDITPTPKRTVVYPQDFASSSRSMQRKLSFNKSTAPSSSAEPIFLPDSQASAVNSIYNSADIITATQLAPPPDSLDDY